MWLLCVFRRMACKIFANCQAATKKAVIKKLATSFAVTTCQRQCIQEDNSNSKIHISSSYAYNNMLWAAITRENIPQNPFINFTALLKLPLDVLIAVDFVVVVGCWLLLLLVVMKILLSGGNRCKASSCPNGRPTGRLAGRRDCRQTKHSQTTTASRQQALAIWLVSSHNKNNNKQPPPSP